MTRFQRTIATLTFFSASVSGPTIKAQTLATWSGHAFANHKAHLESGSLGTALRKREHEDPKLAGALRRAHFLGQNVGFDQAESITANRSGLKAHRGCTICNGPHLADAAFKKHANLTPVKQDLSGNYGDETVEITFIPVVSEPGDWQGTMVGDRYDGSGNLISEYVANVILIEPDPTVYSWNLTYEQPIGDTGEPVKGNPGGPVQPLSPNSQLKWGVPFREQQPAVAATLEALKQPHAESVAWLGGWGAWGKCTGAWSVGAAVGCAVGNAWNAGIAFGPCAAAGAITAAIGCTYGTLWN